MYLYYWEKWVLIACCASCAHSLFRRPFPASIDAVDVRHCGNGQSWVDRCVIVPLFLDGAK